MNDLDTLAHNISVHGIGAYEDEVRGLAGRASRTGIAPAITSVLADPHAPAVARERAFARVATAIRTRTVGNDRHVA